MKRVKLTVSYDGTNYCGWQIQPNAVTVEGKLNSALSKLTGEEIKVIGASRTDAGVHAFGNVAVFDTNSTIPPEKFSYAVNRLLPNDIVVRDSIETADDFHPRFCDTVKTYEYRILNGRFPVPQERNFSWHVSFPLDIGRMQEAAGFLIGEHDFKSFCSVKTQTETTVRTIYSVEVLEETVSTMNKIDVDAADCKLVKNTSHSFVTVRIRGNGFLYNMVRIIAGTLVQVGNGHTAPEKVKDMLDCLDRTTSGPTAPPQGLTLMGIKYV